MDQVNLAAWIDRKDVVEGGVSARQAELINATVGCARGKAPNEGEALPPLWHWYAFPPTVGMRGLGIDGHPHLGAFMPPVKLNRRMWAGGSLEFRAPLRVGDALERRTTIASIAEKSGKAGDIVVVGLDHEVHGPSGLAVLERQNIVYLQIPDRYVPPRAVPAAEQVDVKEPAEVSTPLLFRYSAITFNAHRIHYDLPYTQEIEHYPDLIVHGPLQAQLLMDMATRQRGSAPQLFSYRGVHPLFVSDAVDLRIVKSLPSDWALSVNANGTHQTMQANAIWEI